MDWETLYCPNPACPFYGVRFGESRLVKNGTTRDQRQALCRTCGSSIALTYGTPSLPAGEARAVRSYRQSRRASPPVSCYI
jgi:hypothetical protein